MQALRVLVVDDEESVREFIAQRLTQDRHHVETAADGAEAWLAFEKSPFDIVITDLNMPRMGGVELVRRLKEAAPQTVTIVLTGYGTLDSAADLLRQGCDDYLFKPIENLDVVAHSIEKSLARRNALLMAISASKISEAKDNLLDLVIGEFEERLGALRKELDKLSPAVVASEAAKFNEVAQGMQAQLAQISAIIKDAKSAHRAVRERSAGQ